jgi:hypothetical protein
MTNGRNSTPEGASEDNNINPHLEDTELGSKDVLNLNGKIDIQDSDINRLKSKYEDLKTRVETLKAGASDPDKSFFDDALGMINYGLGETGNIVVWKSKVYEGLDQGRGNDYLDAQERLWCWHEGLTRVLNRQIKQIEAGGKASTLLDTSFLGVENKDSWANVTALHISNNRKFFLENGRFPEQVVGGGPTPGNAPGTTPGTTPGNAPGNAPGTTPETTPGTTPETTSANPDGTPPANPDGTSPANPDEATLATPSANPDENPPANPDEATPATPSANPDENPPANPDEATPATPDGSEDDENDENDEDNENNEDNESTTLSDIYRFCDENGLEPLREGNLVYFDLNLAYINDLLNALIAAFLIFLNLILNMILKTKGLLFGKVLLMDWNQ